MSTLATYHARFQIFGLLKRFGISLFGPLLLLSVMARGFPKQQWNWIVQCEEGMQQRVHEELSCSPSCVASQGRPPVLQKMPPLVLFAVPPVRVLLSPVVVGVVNRYIKEVCRRFALGMLRSPYPRYPLLPSGSMDFQ